MQLGAEIALSHHEKYDGSGYPNGLKDEAISVYGRIVAVADVFDALTSERPYKRAWTVDDAIGLLRENSGKHFDRSCVYAFLLDMDEILTIKEKFKDTE
jgi:putative two-component system response regulator